MSDLNEIDHSNPEMTVIDGTVIERDFVHLVEYYDKNKRFWDEFELSRVSSVDLSNKA